MSILALTSVDRGDSSNCSKVGVSFPEVGGEFTGQILLASFETPLLGPTSLGVTRV